MKTIFVDESGYTGQNLLDPAQPIYALASLQMEEEECKELKKSYFGSINANELKYSSIKQSPAKLKLLFKFLEDMRGKSKHIKFNVVDKKFALLVKLVDLIIEPGMYKDGIDLYERGGNIALSNILYTTIPVFEGEEFLTAILERFQKMMKSRTMWNYGMFFSAVLNYEYKHRESEEILKYAVFGAYENVGWNLLNIPKNSLNLVFTSALTLIALWRKDISANNTIELVHDRSKELLKQKDLWDAVVDPQIASQVIGYDIRTYNFPLAVSKTLAGEDSQHWAGLQIADLLAGACVDGMKWLLEEHSKNEGLNFDLNQIVNSGDFFIHSLWHHHDYTPEDLGTTGDNSFSVFKKFEDIIRSTNI